MDGRRLMTPSTPNDQSPDADDLTRLWPFCLALYARPGIASDCIMLQDQIGVDVNLLLYACWAACFCDKPLTQEDFAPLIAATERWRTEVIVPIRAARRAAKAAAESQPLAEDEQVVPQLRDVELAAEKVEIAILADLAPPPVPIRPAAVEGRAQANLAAYISALALRPDSETQTALDRIAAAAAAIGAPPAA